MPHDPFLDAVLEDITPGPNGIPPAIDVATLTDVAAAYAPAFIKAFSACELSSRFLVKRGLRKKFGRDFLVREFDRLVQEAERELVRNIAAPNGRPKGMVLNDNGNPRPVMANAALQLEAAGLKVGYDRFASRITILERSPWGTDGPWSDQDDLEAANYLQHHKVLVACATAHEAVNYLAYQSAFHPVRDWLCALKWDGTPRLDTWMSKYLGAVAREEKYLTGISNAWPISAVARILNPGCFAKHLIVLEGKQSIGKSRALRALTNGHMSGEGGIQWFRDSMPDIDSDDIGLFMQGVWVIEIAELEAIRGKQWTRVKAFISTQSDPFRRKFGRNLHDYPRQCIFAGSTNETHWGGDTSGLTRFWPAAVTKVDVDGILRDREQLWAEARFKFDEGSSVFLDETTEKLAAVEQLDRAPDDAWIDLILDKTALMSETSVAEVLEKIAQKPDQANNIHAGKVLASLGWTRYRSTAEGRPWRYRRPD